MSKWDREEEEIKDSEYKIAVVVAILAVGTLIAIWLGGQNSYKDSAQIAVYISIALAFMFIAIIKGKNK